MHTQLTIQLTQIYFCLFVREEDKNIFDYCRENNIDHINKALSSQKVDVNTKDEEVTYCTVPKEHSQGQ